MSNYNTQLQSNNIDLQMVLQTLQNKGAGGGGQVEWSENENKIISREISGAYFNSNVKTVGTYAFFECSGLTTVSFPACTNISIYAFYYCSNLTTVNFPECVNIGSSTFAHCDKLTTANFPKCTNIDVDAFFHCDKLTTVNFPECTNIGIQAFLRCQNLTSANFPVCTNISSRAFYQCQNLTTVSIPECVDIGSSAFCECHKLTTVSLPKCANINIRAFEYCYNLKSLYLTNSKVCILSNSNAFIATPIGGYSESAGVYGSIYVPMSLINAYKAATNWTYFADKIVGISDGEPIPFTINSVTYQAEEGMTWAEWINSDFCPSENFDIIDDNIIRNGDEIIFHPDDYHYVTSTELIEAGCDYGIDPY